MKPKLPKENMKILTFILLFLFIDTILIIQIENHGLGLASILFVILSISQCIIIDDVIGNRLTLVSLSNALILQWLFLRFTKHINTTENVERFSFQGFIVPVSGYINPKMIWVNNKPFYFYVTDWKSRTTQIVK